MVNHGLYCLYLIPWWISPSRLLATHRGENSTAALALKEERAALQGWDRDRARPGSAVGAVPKNGAKTQVETYWGVRLVGQHAKLDSGNHMKPPEGSRGYVTGCTMSLFAVDVVAAQRGFLGTWLFVAWHVMDPYQSSCQGFDQWLYMRAVISCEGSPAYYPMCVVSLSSVWYKTGTHQS